jgi:hypothetical protein
LAEDLNRKKWKRFALNPPGYFYFRYRCTVLLLFLSQVRKMRPEHESRSAFGMGMGFVSTQVWNEKSKISFPLGSMRSELGIGRHVGVAAVKSTPRGSQDPGFE